MQEHYGQILLYIILGALGLYLVVRLGIAYYFERKLRFQAEMLNELTTPPNRRESKYGSKHEA